MKFKQTNTQTILCMGQDISLKSERKNHDLNHDLAFLHTQSIVCATVYGQCLEYLVYITLGWPPSPSFCPRSCWMTPKKKSKFKYSRQEFIHNWEGCYCMCAISETTFVSTYKASYIKYIQNILHPRDWSPKFATGINVRFTTISSQFFNN